MKILMVNKFLFEKGGAETYVLKLYEFLQSHGHEVQVFGMQDERNIVGNKWNILTKNIDFHKKTFDHLLYPFKIIYSAEARRKIKRLLRLFQPDVVHLNNINFQLTPSILYEIKKSGVPVVFTAHDCQLLCPNHMMFQPNNAKRCDDCVTMGFRNCVKNKCIHGSTLRSLLGCAESMLYHGLNTYSLIDKVICPSRFLEGQLLRKAVFKGKTIVMHNFIQRAEPTASLEKEDYVVYFGRFSGEKGINTLLEACRKLPEINFVFAGSGPLEGLLTGMPNVKNVGFLRGDALKKLVSGARFSVLPSEWYENCPFSVMESQMFGTPVIGSDIGGIPELIEDERTGLLFKPGDAADLAEKINSLWQDRKKLREMTENCANVTFDTLDVYGEKLLALYGGSFHDNF